MELNMFVMVLKVDSLFFLFNRDSLIQVRSLPGAFPLGLVLCTGPVWSL